ncbi:Tetratricopeptide repeat protein 28 [Tupaia chinensis]|uniref:Tetratricopeptide repeat protein 28 n=1 Tax=Tupaia chinensis TaxID=246437 RepID=L9KUD2_TUPCH|nr:Tetratricopeptide repeat protein 28 [Tupaia chinensis]
MAMAIMAKSDPEGLELGPLPTPAYFRQGVALQYLGRHADALAAFASGLAQDPKSLQLLVGMVEAAMKSPMRDSLEPTYQQLQKMKLDKSPFVVVSVVGQELLTAGHHGASVVVLEAALKIGTCSLKLRGSVFSALSSAYWSLGNTEKSTGYMQQDLDVAKTLANSGYQTGECRAHGNLGSAFFSKGNYREALTNHRHQLVLAMKLKDREISLEGVLWLGAIPQCYEELGYLVGFGNWLPVFCTNYWQTDLPLFIDVRVVELCFKCDLQWFEWVLYWKADFDAKGPLVT